MTRKRLPRAIAGRGGEQVGNDVGAVARVGSRKESPPSAAKPAVDQDAADNSGWSSDRPIESSHPPPASGEIISPGSSQDHTGRSRRASAEKIVERYKLYAAVGGLLPIPAVNVAGLTAINMQMVRTLSQLYGMPFERNQTRSMIVGLMGGAVPTGLGFATASTIALVLPGAGFVGLAVSTMTAAAVTRSIGLLFVDHFESETVSPPA